MRSEMNAVKLAELTAKVERYEAALREIEGHGTSLDSDILAVQTIARAALAADTPGPIWMPICRQCANGPLTGESLTTGLCDECSP